MKYPDDFINKVIQGDCLEVLKTFPDNSVDAIVTDPPAGIGFMGKTWDKFKDINSGRERSVNEITAISKGPESYNSDLIGFQNFICQVFTEAIRVLKPGGHALVWAIPRTSHHTAMGLERAGFEIRDRISHCFGSGFPKSLNIGKAVDKIQDKKIENKSSFSGVSKERDNTKNIMRYKKCDECGKLLFSPNPCKCEWRFKKSENEFEGLGTALKPAIEDWWLCRKSLSEKTIAENCLKWGVGGLSIDDCRVNYISDYDEKHQSDIASGQKNATNGKFFGGKGKSIASTNTPIGRFPSHLILDDSQEVKDLFPNTKTGSMSGNYEMQFVPNEKSGNVRFLHSVGSEGSASRFFYCAKSSRSERNMGCEGLDTKKGGGMQARNDGSLDGHITYTRNNHPTVKPIALMSYLVKLISRPNQIVLDPFAGSGSTLIACKQEGRRFIGIEKEADYVKIAEARLKAVPKKLL